MHIHSNLLCFVLARATCHSHLCGCCGIQWTNRALWPPLAECHNLENSKWPINRHKWSKFNCDECIPRPIHHCLRRHKANGKTILLIARRFLTFLFRTKFASASIHTQNVPHLLTARQTFCAQSLKWTSHDLFFFSFRFSEIIFFSLFLFIDAFIGRVYRFRLVWYVNMR